MWKAYPRVLARTRRNIYRISQAVPTVLIYGLCYFTQLSRTHAQFLLRRFLELKWVTQLMIDVSNILSILVENLHFLDSFIYVPMRFKSIPKSFHLTCKNVYYTHFFNTCNNLDYVGSHPNLSTMGQPLCLVMTELNFRPGIRGKRRHF